MVKKTYTRGALRLVIDTSNADTPAMVEYGNGRVPSHSSTYSCAMGEGELLSNNYSRLEGDYTLSIAQYAWLEKYEDEVDAAYTEARKGMPEYS